MKGINCEVTKNLILAGVNLTIQDDSLVDLPGLGSNYFVTKEDLGKNVAESSHSKIQNLNMYAKVDFETKPLKDIDDLYFKNFNVIIMSSDFSDEVRILFYFFLPLLHPFAHYYDYYYYYYY